MKHAEVTNLLKKRQNKDKTKHKKKEMTAQEREEETMKHQRREAKMTVENWISQHNQLSW